MAIYSIKRSEFMILSRCIIIKTSELLSILEYVLEDFNLKLFLNKLLQKLFLTNYLQTLMEKVL